MCCANLLSSSVAVFAFCAPTPAAHAYLGARNFGSSSSVIATGTVVRCRAKSMSTARDTSGYYSSFRSRPRLSSPLVCARREARPGRGPACALWGTAACSARGAAVYVHYVRSRSLVHRLRYNFLHTCKVGLTRPTHDTTETTVQRNPPTRVTRDRTRACAPQPQRHTSLDPGQSHEVKHSAPETQTQGVAALQTHCHGAPGCTSTLAHQHGGRAPSTRSRSRT